MISTVVLQLAFLPAMVKCFPFTIYTRICCHFFFTLSILIGVRWVFLFKNYEKVMWIGEYCKMYYKSTIRTTCIYLMSTFICWIYIFKQIRKGYIHSFVSDWKVLVVDSFSIRIGGRYTDYIKYKLPPPSSTYVPLFYLCGPDTLTVVDFHTFLINV